MNAHARACAREAAPRAAAPGARVARPRFGRWPRRVRQAPGRSPGRPAERQPLVGRSPRDRVLRGGHPLRAGASRRASLTPCTRACAGGRPSRRPAPPQLARPRLVVEEAAQLGHRGGVVASAASLSAFAGASPFAAVRAPARVAVPFAVGGYWRRRVGRRLVRPYRRDDELGGLRPRARRVCAPACRRSPRGSAGPPIAHRARDFMLRGKRVWLEGLASARGWSRPARRAPSSSNVTVGSSFSPWR
jgi:hypothetical protein